MEPLGFARWGLWLFTAGIFGWIFPNLADGDYVNVFTDVVIVVSGILAAVGLPRAIDGIGNGLLRTGLVGVAIGQAMQNVVSSLAGFDAGSAAPRFVVMLAAVALVVGVKLWQEDGWDARALPWLAGGFLGFAFEPVYYFLLGLAGGSPFGRYFPGSVGVAAGALLAMWGFWTARMDAAAEG